MSTRNYNSLGIMTGTSMDGLDLSLIKSDGENEIIFVDGQVYDFPDNLRKMMRTIVGSKKPDSAVCLVEQEYTNFIIKKIKIFIKKNIQ